QLRDWRRCISRDGRGARLDRDGRGQGGVTPEYDTIDRVSDHRRGTRFVNPSGPALQPMTKVARMLREPSTPWPRRIDVPAAQPPALDGAAAAVTFIGHSTFLIQTSAGTLLTDPMYSWRAGPMNLLGPRRVRPPAIRFDDLPPISTILLSHNHYDH